MTYRGSCWLAGAPGVFREVRGEAKGGEMLAFLRGGGWIDRETLQVYFCSNLVQFPGVLLLYMSNASKVLFCLVKPRQHLRAGMDLPCHCSFPKRGMAPWSTGSDPPSLLEGLLPHPGLVSLLLNLHSQWEPSLDSQTSKPDCPALLFDQ